MDPQKKLGAYIVHNLRQGNNAFVHVYNNGRQGGNITL
jgi:hypothetical protein